jgi:hypothetical protein
MGVWDETCLICGCGLRNLVSSEPVFDKSFIEVAKEAKIKHKECNWLNNLIIVTSEEKKVKMSGDNYSEYGSFNVIKNGRTIAEYGVTPINWHEPSYGVKIHEYGVVCHEDCYKLLNQKLNYKLEFADVARLLSDTNCLLKRIGVYGDMKKYIRQDFDYVSAYNENKYLLSSPLKNMQNQKRILSIWTKLVEHFRKNPPRPSPVESANNFEVEKVMVGYDKKKWIVKKIGKTKKWIHSE